MDSFLEIVFLSLVFLGMTTAVLSIRDSQPKLVLLSLSLRTAAVITWLLWLAAGDPSGLSNLLGTLAAIGLIPGLGRYFALASTEKTAPTHRAKGYGRHPIFFGRTRDEHQNPLCRTCGQTLSLQEFEQMRAADLVVC